MNRLGVPELMVILTVLMTGFVIALLPTIFYLLTLQKALNRCAVQNRTISPGQVWLLLIPLFNFIWNFIVVSRVSSSLANEFRMRKLTVEQDPGKTLGLAYSILLLCSIIPLLGFLSALGALVCWIIYWIKIADYSGRIAMPAAAGTAGA